MISQALGNGLYSQDDLNAFVAPFRNRNMDRGGFVAFPLMVPIFPEDR